LKFSTAAELWNMCRCSRTCLSERLRKRLSCMLYWSFFQLDNHFKLTILAITFEAGLMIRLL